MSSKAVITVHRPRDEVERRWREYRSQSVDAADASVTFADAPGDRGTEIHVELGSGGRLGALKRLAGRAALPNVKDDLRRFKQLIEAGEIARSDGSPQGERAERKLKRRPAQPLEQSQLEQAGVR